MLPSSCTERFSRRVLRAVALACLAAAALPPVRAEDAPPAAARLQALRAELQPELRRAAFGQPLVLQSRQEGDHVYGDVYAEMAFPLARVAQAVANGAALCEVLMLHQTVHSCRPAAAPDGGETLALTIGPQRSQSSAPHVRVVYRMRVEASTPRYAKTSLVADRGPLGTYDYRIAIEAVPSEGGGSFVHFAFGQGYGALGRAAMSLYLATSGRSKVGFTVVGRDAEGRPQFVRGERGALERNVLRYYLALQVWCGVDRGTPAQRWQARMREFHAATERYPQLREMTLAEYVEEKQRDLGLVATAPR